MHVGNEFDILVSENGEVLVCLHKPAVVDTFDLPGVEQLLIKSLPLSSVSTPSGKRLRPL
jgi:hypothetical protein